MTTWNQLADPATIETTAAALRANGITVEVVPDAAAAKAKALELIPAGAEVLTMTSITLDTLGLPQTINESGQYNAVRAQLNTMNRETQGSEMQKLGAAPGWTIGSVHAVTQDGKVVIASNTGSQLPAYAYGASHVIWIVGAQKIVANLDAAMQRVYEHVLPLESERAHQAYGVPGSFVSKLLVINREVNPGRLTMIIVNEALGF
jgi:L-lactate utilization protein LutC